MQSNFVFTRIALPLSRSLGETNGAQREETVLKGTVCSEIRSNQAPCGQSLQPFLNFCFAIGVLWLEFFPSMELITISWIRAVHQSPFGVSHLLKMTPDKMVLSGRGQSEQPGLMTGDLIGDVE